MKKHKQAMDNMEVNMLATYEEFNKAWASVQLARSQDRPQTRNYIQALTTEFFEVKGDRCLGDDNAIVTGIGKIGERAFTIIGQQEGYDLNDKKSCNFGMPHPAGYRKSMRAIRQAEKFGRPILCLIDTLGAFCGIKAEEQGQGTVIAEHLQLIASVKVPVISVVLGEGGSGGALALALSDRLIMLENSYFSVITPEGCASILFKDANKAHIAAESLKLTSSDLIDLGVADCVIKEKKGYSIDNMQYTLYKVRDQIEKYIAELEKLDRDDLVAKRYDKILGMKGCN